LAEAKSRSSKAAAPETEEAPVDESTEDAQYTPQQAIQSSRELAGGEPAWLVQEALTKADLMGAELISPSQITDAVNKLKQQKVPQAPLPGAVSTGAEG
jgi:hypothetical protein